QGRAGEHRGQAHHRQGEVAHAHQLAAELAREPGRRDDRPDAARGEQGHAAGGLQHVDDAASDRADRLQGNRDACFRLGQGQAPGAALAPLSGAAGGAAPGWAGVVAAAPAAGADGRRNWPTRPNRSTEPWVFSISDPALRLSVEPPGSMEMCWPPSRPSEVILATESAGRGVLESRSSLTTARKVLGSRVMLDTVPTFTPATLTTAPGASAPTWPNLACTS